MNNIRKDNTNDNLGSKIPFQISIMKNKLGSRIDQRIDLFLDQLESVEHKFYRLDLNKNIEVNIDKRNNQFYVEVVLDASIFGKGLLKKVKANGQIYIEIRIEYHYKGVNEIVFGIEIMDCRWSLPAILHIGGGKMEIEKVSDALLGRLVVKLQDKLTSISEKAINPQVLLFSLLKNRKHITIPVEDRNIQVLLQSTSINMNDIVFHDDIFLITGNCASTIELFEQDKIFELTLDEDILFSLNAEVEYVKDEIILPINVSYNWVQSLFLEKIKVSQIEFLGKNINILQLEIVKKTSNEVTIIIWTDHKAFKKLKIETRPRLDIENQQLWMDDLKIELIETNFWGRSMMLADDLIIKGIKKRINPIRLTPIFDKVKAMIDTKMVSLGDKIDVQLDQDSILLNHIEFRKDVINLVFSSKLKIDVSIVEL